MAAQADSADEASRILMISGQAGSGKTHLVTNEFARLTHPTYGVMIYKPDNYSFERDFDKWLNQKVAGKLIKAIPGTDENSSALQQIARAVGRKLFPKGKKGSKALKMTNDVLEVLVDAADRNAFSRGIATLYGPISQQKRVLKEAEEWAFAIGVSDLKGGTEFCVALLLMCGSRANEAAKIFSNGKVPETLKNCIAQDAVDSWGLLQLVTRALAYIGGSLIVFFDQLESLITKDSNSSASLKGLIAASLGVVQTNRNAGVIISAPPEIADEAIEGLLESDQHRVTHPYGVVSLELVRKGEVARFFQSRFEYLRDFGFPRDKLESCNNFACWLDDNAMLVPLPPRLLLVAAHGFARSTIDSSAALSVDDMAKVWTASIAKFDTKKTPSVVVVRDSPPSTRDKNSDAGISQVEEKWITLEAEYANSPRDVENAEEALELLTWFLPTFAPVFPGVNKLTVINRGARKGISSLQFRITFESKSAIERELLILDQVNYAGKLLDTLRKIQHHKPLQHSVIARLGDNFPRSGKLLTTLNQLRRENLALTGLLPAETINIKQIRALAGRTNEEHLLAWFRAKAFELSTVAACYEYK